MPTDLITLVEQNGYWLATLQLEDYRAQHASNLLHFVMGWTRDKGKRMSMVLDCTKAKFLNYEAVGAVRHLGMTCLANGGRLVVFGANYNTESVFLLLELDPNVLIVAEDKNHAIQLARTARAA